MKTFLLALLLSLGAASYGFGQEPAKSEAGEKAGQHEEEGDPRLIWKWANFAILAVLLGWGLSKSLPPFLEARSAEIGKGITDATKFEAQAAAKAKQLEDRLARIDVEIEALRPLAMNEMKAEGSRIQRETETFVAKIEDGAVAEIEAAGKQSRAELRALSAKLAIDLAAERLRNTTGKGLVDRFIADLAKTTAGRKEASS